MSKPKKQFMRFIFSHLLFITSVVQPLFSQDSVGCAIFYADNYDSSATGCEDGSLDCCEFNCSLEYSSADETLYTEDCGDEDYRDKLSYPEGYLDERIRYIKNTELRNDREFYDIPIVFHDAYGLGYIEEFDEYVPGINDEGEINRSLCSEVTDSVTCECLAYQAVKILNEQYSSGNLRFYRACTGENDRILSFEECNSGQGDLISFQELEDFISRDLNNLPGHPELDANEGWSNYFNNALNIYVTECIQFNRFGDNCDSNLNGFAQRGSYGSHLHRGLSIRQDAFFSVYSDIDEINNYSTLPHELGHTFNLNHVWKHNGCSNVDYDPDGEECLLTGDLICDTEAAPCEGFDWSRSNFWMDSLSQIYCTFIGQGRYPTGLHECGTVPNEDMRSRIIDNETGDYLTLGTWQNVRNVNTNISTDLSVFVNPVLHSETNNWDGYIYDAHDSLGRTYGTRELEELWNEECQEWIIDDYWETVENGLVNLSPIMNFMADGAVRHCRNLGCESNNPFCTPLEGFSNQQFLAAKYDIEYYLIGCTDPAAINYNPNIVINNGSCIYEPTQMGDINGDGLVDVFDILLVIDFMLSTQIPTPSQFAAADLNHDTIIDVFDVILLIDVILGSEF